MYRVLFKAHFNIIVLLISGSYKQFLGFMFSHQTLKAYHTARPSYPPWFYHPNFICHHSLCNLVIVTFYKIPFPEYCLIYSSIFSCRFYSNLTLVISYCMYPNNGSVLHPLNYLYYFKPPQQILGALLCKQQVTSQFQTQQSLHHIISVLSG